MSEQDTSNVTSPEVTTIPPELAAGIESAKQFTDEHAPQVGALFGTDLTIVYGDEWATPITPGSNEVIVDLSYFIERDYTPEMASYALIHEVSSHMRTNISDPDLTREYIGFSKQGEPQSLFHNILTDIRGNKLTHALLPEMRTVGEQLYAEKLFPQTDYTAWPRHTQFLYTIIRQEMVPGVPIIAAQEVHEAIARLRNFQGSGGDVIAYSTDPAPASDRVVDDTMRFAIWKKIIYPEYQRLLQQDRDEYDRQTQTIGHSDEKRFSETYDDYHRNRHPEPMSTEETDKLTQRSRRRQHRSREDELAEQVFKAETGGHDFDELEEYQAVIDRKLGIIADMEDAIREMISRRSWHTGFGLKNSVEGITLDSQRLTQTYIDTESGLLGSPAFLAYNPRALQGETVKIPNVNIRFAFDESTSIQEIREAITGTVVVALEGGAGVARTIAEAQESSNLELGQVYTSVCTFGEKVQVTKELSTTLNDKERLDTYSHVAAARSTDTRDIDMLQYFLRQPKQLDHEEVLLIVTDNKRVEGQRESGPFTRMSVDQLMDKGWHICVIVVGERSDVIEEMYAPDIVFCVQNAEELPATIGTFMRRGVNNLMFRPELFT